MALVRDVRPRRDRPRTALVRNRERGGPYCRAGRTVAGRLAHSGAGVGAGTKGVAGRRELLVLGHGHLGRRRPHAARERIARALAPLLSEATSKRCHEVAGRFQAEDPSELAAQWIEETIAALPGAKV